MRMLFVVVAVVLMAGVCAASDDGFVSIFNGKDLSGWVVEGNPEGFTVIDGCMHSDGGKGGDWIRTEKPYANYVMRLEWMLSKTGNSGIFVRQSIPAGKGFEVQLLAPWTPYRDDLHCTGSMYSFVEANPRPDETTLRWRTAEITCEYKHVKAAIDGVVTSEAHYDKVESMKNQPLVGYPGMQDSHTGPGEWVKFRNIRIKDLDQDPGFVMKGIRSDDAAIRRLAFDAAVRLGVPMVDLLLDTVADGGPAQAHTAEIALSRIAARSTAPGAEKQAEQVRLLLTRRLAEPGRNDARDRIVALKLLALVGRDDAATAGALRTAIAAGGPVAEAALAAARQIPGSRITRALVDAATLAGARVSPSLILAVGERRDPAALSTLSKLTATGQAETRLAAVRALGLLGTTKSIPALRKTASGAPEKIRSAVADSLIILMDTRGLDDASRAEALKAARELAVTDAQKAAVGR